MDNNGITLQQNEDGTWGKYEEPYATIEVRTKEELDDLVELIELGKKAREKEREEVE